MSQNFFTVPAGTSSTAATTLPPDRASFCMRMRSRRKRNRRTVSATRYTAKNTADA